MFFLPRRPTHFFVRPQLVGIFETAATQIASCSRHSVLHRKNLHFATFSPPGCVSKFKALHLFAMSALVVRPPGCILKMHPLGMIITRRARPLKTRSSTGKWQTQVCELLAPRGFIAVRLSNAYRRAPLLK